MSHCVHVILLPPIGSLKFLENVALGDWKGVVTFQGIWKQKHSKCFHFKNWRHSQPNGNIKVKDNKNPHLRNVTASYIQQLQNLMRLWSIMRKEKFNQFMKQNIAQVFWPSDTESNWPHRLHSMQEIIFNWPRLDSHSLLQYFSKTGTEMAILYSTSLLWALILFYHIVSEFPLI